MKRRGITLILVLTFLGLLTACGPGPVELVIQTHVVTVVHTQVVTVVVQATHEPGLELSVPTPEPAPASGDWIPSEEAAAHIGETVKVRIERADCSYQSTLNGAPTFCNDAPYPGHSFTLVVWRQDWSDLDGACIIVSGEVTAYNGLPQVEAESRDQVTACSP